MCGDRLYLKDMEVGKPVRIKLPMMDAIREYRYKDQTARLKWVGEEVVAAVSKGKRLCFFTEI